jgi:hypothetical protein
MIDLVYRAVGVKVISLGQGRLIAEGTPTQQVLAATGSPHPSPPSPVSLSFSPLCPF